MQSAHDWAAIDPSKNMTLADADHLRDVMAAGFGIQFGNRFVRTQYGNVISEAELRANNFMSPLAVNLCGYLAAYGSQEVNIAQFRANLRQAAASGDPTGELVGILQQAMPATTNIASLFTRMPAVQDVIASALRSV